MPVTPLSIPAGRNRLFRLRWGLVWLLAMLAVAVLAAGCVGGGSTVPSVGPVHSAPPGAPEAVPNEYFHGSFECGSAGCQAEMDPVVLAFWPADSPEDDPTEGFFIEFRDAAGNMVRWAGLDATEYNDDDGTLKGFIRSWVVAPPGYASYAVLRHGEEMITVPRSPNPPTAKLTGVTAGQRFGHEDTITLELELADPDGDQLTYRPYYSTGPERGYESIGSLLGTSINKTDPVIELSAGALAGSAQARLAVSVSDGVNSTFVETPAFQIPYRTPQVELLASKGDRFLGEGRWAEFEVRVDDRDGFYDGQGTLVWASDLDGIIGTSAGSRVRTIQIYTRKLSEGQHTLTVTATDSTGLSGTASAPMFVLHESYTPPPPSPRFRAQDDYAKTQVGETIDIDVAVNDVAEEGYSYIQLNTAPVLGEAEAVVVTGSSEDIRYTALAAGRDEFTYDICTGDHDCRTATVFVTVDPAG